MPEARYVLSERAANALRSLIAPGSGFSSKDRRIIPDSTIRVRPFACRIDPHAGEEGDETHMLCYLPPLCTDAIRWEDTALAPQSSLGSVDHPWVDLGSWTPSLRVWLAIAPPIDPPAGSTSGGYAGGWAIVLSATAPTSLSGHPAYAHLVAAMESGTSGVSRFVQYHLGSMLLAGGEGECCPDEYSVEEESGTLPTCVAKRYVFARQHYEVDPTTGECVESTGTGSRETTNIDVPKPPEYALTVGGTASKPTISLTRTPCGGEPSTAGGTYTFNGLASVADVGLMTSLTVYNGALYRRMVKPTFDPATGALTFPAYPGGTTIGGIDGWFPLTPNIGMPFWIADFTYGDAAHNYGYSYRIGTQNNQITVWAS